MFDSIFVVKKLNDASNQNIKLTCNEINSICNDFRLKFLNEEKLITPSTLIISLGGDGTMMYAMKLGLLYNAKCLGVNLGNLGFLTPFDTNFLRNRSFITLLKGLLYDFRVEQRYMIDSISNETTAVNEFVLSSTSSRDMIQYEIYVDDILMGNHTASAFVLSTATGSTAYSLNAGGSIISPDERVMQILNVNPASLGTRPIMLGGNKSIKVVVTNIRGSGYLDLRVDGVSVDINLQKVFEFNMSNESVEVVLPSNYNFFNNLSDKLFWNKHFV